MRCQDLIRDKARLSLPYHARRTLRMLRTLCTTGLILLGQVNR